MRNNPHPPIDADRLARLLKLLGRTAIAFALIAAGAIGAALIVGEGWLFRACLVAFLASEFLLAVIAYALFQVAGAPGMKRSRRRARKRQSGAVPASLDVRPPAAMVGQAGGEVDSVPPPITADKGEGSAVANDSRPAQ